MTRSYAEFSKDMQQAWDPRARDDAKTMAVGAWGLYEADLRRQAGRALKALRTEQGLRQADVASLAGVRQTDVSAIERGEGNPTTRTLFAITTSLQAQVHIVAANTDEAMNTSEAMNIGVEHPEHRQLVPTT